MILEDKILINVSGATKQRYIDLGYNVPESVDKLGRLRTPRGTKIEVSICDLPKDSHVKINVACDCCGEIIHPTYQAYNQRMEQFGNYVCGRCRNKHQKQTVSEKYNVDNISQIDDVKVKKKEKSLSKYGVENVAQSEDVKQKIKNTNLERYNKTSFTQTNEYLEKRKNTIIKKYGSEETYKEHMLQQVKQTNREKYGVDWYMQTDGFKEKSTQTLYDKGLVPTSSQQIYICDIYGGILNYPLSSYFLDIFMPDDKIDVEVDFGGHNLSVKKGNITQEEFNVKELIREKTIRKNNIKIMRLISPHDKLPSDNKLIEIYNFAKQYFESTNHTWIYFYIEENKYRNAEYQDQNGNYYDFEELWNAKKLAKKEVND